MSTESSSEIEDKASLTASAGLHPDDVLLGRGLGASQYSGNKRFRRLVESRKDEYILKDSYKEKSSIAKEVFQAVISGGGRFLQLEDPKKPGARNVVQEGVWHDAQEHLAMEKIKQALREKREKTESSSDGSACPPSNKKKKKLPLEDGSEGAKVTVAPTTEDNFGGLHYANEAAHLRKKTLEESVESRTYFSTDEAPIAPFLNSPSRPLIEERHTPAEYSPLSRNALDSTLTGGWSHLDSASEDALPSEIWAELLDDPSPLVLSPPAEAQAAENRVPSGSRLLGDDDSYLTSLDFYSDDYGTEILAMSVSGKPTFTEEQEVEERAKLSNSEQTDVLADLFGSLRLGGAQESKRAKGDNTKDSEDLLLMRMKEEIENVPVAEKQALLLAQAACKKESPEFSDERLKLFLRCEDMNAKLGAHRFVNYWEKRLEVFGREKYLTSMTLSSALQDDLQAVEDGVASILPKPDVAGRPILYVEPNRRTPGKYSSASLLRALWYMMEIITAQCSATNSDYVVVTWIGNATIWDYDHYVYSRIPAYQESCFPVKKAAQHVCCPSQICLKILKPVEAAFLTKKSRLRKLFHCVPESEIPATMSEYGIAIDMLPAVMGGTVEIALSKWMQERLAVGG